jgi:regulator of sirC expression with transglutaminase-like and TPR domain
MQETRFRREVKDLSLETVLLSRVLEKRRGSCVGLSGLYLALGETLNLPLRGVLVPGHFLVRYHGPKGSRDVELLKGGKQMSLKWYREKYDVPAGNPLYLTQSLDVQQTLAVQRYNLANELRSRQRHRAALAHYRQVVTELPRFAEAWANLGLTLHRLRRLDEAERAYRKAQAANPNLSGVEHNLKVLRQEREGPTSFPSARPPHRTSLPGPP